MLHLLADQSLGQLATAEPLPDEDDGSVDLNGAPNPIDVDLAMMAEGDPCDRSSSVDPFEPISDAEMEND
eukprot:6204117-Pyramimonas_sp.AAC.1